MKRIFLVLLSSLVAAVVRAAPLEPGVKAPEFKRPATIGKDVSLSDYSGRQVVLAFFPKAGTPGCTREMSAFRDRLDEFVGAGAQVLGISMDELAAQSKFARDIQATFPLLSDADGAVAEAYGVKGLGFANRVTFVIDKDRKIAAVFQGAQALDPASALATCHRR